MLAESKYFLAIVSDVKNWNAMCAVPGAQVVHDLRFCGSVESCQWFIQQKQPRVRHYSPRQRDPLAFATRNFSWLASAHMRDAKRFEHSVCAHSALRGIKARNPVLNVLFDAEMRKQSEVLKDVTDPARTHRDVDSQALVKPALVCERNVP